MSLMQSCPAITHMHAPQIPLETFAVEHIENKIAHLPRPSL